MTRREPPSSPWLRWTPTLLGVLVAATTIAAYELGGESDPKPRTQDCPPPDRDGERARPSLTPGAARPSPSRRAEAELDQLRGQVAVLEAQAEIIAERSVSGETAYYGLSQPELEALARRCEVRVDYPTRLDEQTAADLGLEPAEAEAWNRALERFAADELGRYRELLAELEPEAAGELDELSLAALRKRLRGRVGRSRSVDPAELRRAVAEERAGLREPPPDPSALATDARLARLRFDAGERFADALADELGAERSEELRQAFAGWPGARTREHGCPGPD